MGVADRRGSRGPAPGGLIDGRYAGGRWADVGIRPFVRLTGAEARFGALWWASQTSVSFAEYAASWYTEQALAPSTMQNYRWHIWGHLVPWFGEMPLDSIRRTDVAEWERSAAGAFAASSVRTWRATLHVILSDAVADGLIRVNPAERRRGRGRRLARGRGPERVITDPWGALLIAERASLLSGRDQEFLAVVLMMYTGMRWGEVVGLETRFVRPGSIRVEWQLYELATGAFARGPPKDGSYRDIDTPPWLSDLLAEHIGATAPGLCACHGRRYVFSGRGGESGRGRDRPTIAEVARRAGVSCGTVSNVSNHPERVSERTRVRVERVLALARSSGRGRRQRSGQSAAHWRRSGFSAWVFTPAVSGWYPARRPAAAHPVAVAGGSRVGVPVRGRGAARRAEACWLPLARGLTPHGLRHAHRTMLDELAVPAALSNERLGHLDQAVSSRYAHVTPAMREMLLAALTVRWEESLAQRRQVERDSAVPCLERLLCSPGRSSRGLRGAGRTGR